MRSSTRGKELTRSCVTCFATDYLILRSIHESKKKLKAMLDSTSGGLSSIIRKEMQLMLSTQFLVTVTFRGPLSIA